MPAAAGVWSKDHGLLWGAKKTRQQPGPEQPGLSVSTHNPHATNRKPATHQTSPKDPPNGPPPRNDDATHHNNTGQTKPARQNQGTGVHNARHQKPQMEPHTRFGRLSPQLSAEREPQTRLAQERERMTKDRRDPGRATPPLRVLSEPTSRPVTPPNTHTRERQPARQTKPETREVNQPPKRRRQTPVPSMNRATAVQNKYHTPTSVDVWYYKYHTPATVDGTTHPLGWSIRTKQGII
ncbi:hypothetical protein BS47DRAFT_1468785 [Hydnum rufescens UP504]|uniref:Uncharacterized protein n=1 Tax=Hydnum rufescens UP504 TaxID=1448309 RepID=A0A9P6B8Q8_9AGAM|nr:hypothetical protein BS47DRAFT_1468785 [Hydnum rufescens UP504]